MPRLSAVRPVKDMVVLDQLIQDRQQFLGLATVLRHAEIAEERFLPALLARGSRIEEASENRQTSGRGFAAVIIHGLCLGRHTQFQRERAHDAENEAVERADPQAVAVVEQDSQQAQIVIRPGRRGQPFLCNHCRGLGALDILGHGRAKMLDDLVKDLARRFAGEGEGADAVRGHTGGHQADVAVGQTEGFACSGRSGDGTVLHGVHGSALQGF